MPLPTPKNNENKDDFMQRCMADPKMGDEYDTNEQRYAVCNVQWEDKDDKAISDIDFKPTTGMAAEARRGLEWRKEYNRGGTAVGVARARDVANRTNLSPSTVKRMHSFFSRHEVDKQGQGFSPGEDGYPSAGRIAWALWGGDPGQSWARKKRNQIEREESKAQIREDVFTTQEEAEERAKEIGCVGTHSHDENGKLIYMPCASHEDYVEATGNEVKAISAQMRAALAKKAKEHNEKVGDVKSKRTSTRTLISVFNRGVGAYHTNPQSVRPSVRSPEQWALARVNSFLYALRNGRFRSGKHDQDLLPSGHPMSSKSLEKSMNKMFNLTSVFKAQESDDGSIRIRGYASTNDTDRAGDIVDKDAWTKGGLQNYENNPILLFNHDYNTPIGKATSLKVTDRGLEIEGIISKSAGKIAEMVKEGILGAFSVGFRVKDADYMEETDGYRIKDAELFEVSVVSVPANQAAVFSVAKSFDSEEDYKAWTAQFRNDPHVVKGQSEEDSPKETANAVFEETIMSDNKDFDIEEFAREVARKTAAEIQMKQAEEKAAAKAELEKAAEEAEVVKAAEEQELQQKKAEVQAVVTGVTTGAERLMADLETRVSEKQEDLGKVVDELRSELKEKSSEIQHIRESKRIFGDRQNNNWKEAFKSDMDDAYILAKATGKGYETNFAKDVMEKVNAHSGVAVSSADIEQEVSTSIERDIQVELVLAPLFREVTLNTATQIVPIMPDSGYAEFTGLTTTDGPAPHGNLATRGDSYVASGSAGDRGGIDMSERTLSAKKLISLSYLGNETEEDAILPILPLIREAVVRSHARAVEHMILVGNSADGVYGTGGAAPNGIIADAIADSDHTTQINSQAFAATVLTAANLLDARQNMGKYGLKPQDVVYIVNQAQYYKLLDDAAYADADKVGNLATKLTGQVGQVYGSPVIVSDEFATPATSKYMAVAVYPKNYVIPRLRGVTVESDYEVANQRRVLVATQRIGFTDIIDNVTTKWALRYHSS